MSLIEWFFWGAIFIVFYAYIGYGILLAILVKLFKRKDLSDSSYQPSVSLIVPCFNEQDYIDAKIDNTLAIDYPRELLEIIFIADGSSDKTPEIIAKRISDGVTLMYEEPRRGKAAAMNRAVREATGDILIFCDANTDLNKEVVSEIVKHYADQEIGAVAGVKKVRIESTDGASSAGEGIYWKYESTLKKWDGMFYTVVGAAGELMSYRRDLYQALEPDTLLDDFMQSMRIAENGHRVLYETNAIATENASENVSEELKRKIRIAAGGWQSMLRLKKAANPFHDFKLWFQYVSHRVLRWSVAAFCLLFLIVSNVWLHLHVGGIYTWILVAQIAFYSLAILGWVLENRSIRVKALYIPYYFTVMNYAVYAGILRLIRGSQSALWERAKRA